MKQSLAIISGIIALSTATIASASDAICTMDYTPVCARVQVQCVKAPCYPIYQTFGNKCMMDASSHATYVRDGECGVALEGAQAVLSENLRAALIGKYTSFKNTISALPAAKQAETLKALVARVDDRKSKLMLVSAITIEKRDMTFAALDLLRDLANTDMTRQQNIAAGAGYLSFSPDECARMDYVCTKGKTGFSDVTGCGCR